MGKQLWVNENRKHAQEIIYWLINGKKPDGWEESPTLEISEYELSSLSNDERIRYTEISPLHIISLMEQENKSKIEDFEDIFEREYKKWIINLPKETRKWKFYLPFFSKPTDIFSPPYRIKLLGTTFSINLRSSVEKNLNSKDRKKLNDARYYPIIEHLPELEIPRLYLMVTGEGITPNLTWLKLIPAFDAFRGLFELTFGIGEMNLSFPEKGIKCKIPHPPWIAHKLGNQPLQTTPFIIDFYPIKDLFDISDEHMQLVKRNAAFLTKPPESNSIQSLIVDGLRIYANAMDSRYPAERLLAFWQLAEAITRVESSGGKTEKVVSRLTLHMHRHNLPGSGYSEGLKQIAKKRNLLVHHGISNSITQYDAFILKLAVETSFIWLINSSKSLPTKLHLDKYYQAREMHDSDTKSFSAMKDTIELIEKEG